jgi:putative ABC transport system permease protein
MKKGLDILIQDIRYAAKSLLRSPGFTLVAALTAALGIGANTAVFSMINAIMLRPLNFPQPERLVNLKEIVPAFAHLYPVLPVNGKHFHAWEQQCSSFESIALVDSGNVTVSGGAPPERVSSRAVTWNYFHLLGVSAVAGRTFVPSEDRPGENRVAVVTGELWSRRFGNDSLRQQTMMVNGVPHVVIGILPSSFRAPEPQSEEESREIPEVFTPLALDYAGLPDMGDFNYQAIGRLRPGVSFQNALSELNVVQAGVAKTAGLDTELKAAMQPLRDTVVGNMGRNLLLLFCAVGVVLLVACVNLANLLLERTSWRMTESSIRSALGASRGRLLRQALTESLLLALLGGLLGAAFAYLGLNLLVSSAPMNIPRLDEVRLDATVLTFALLISTVSGLVFGILPSWWLRQAQPIDALRGRGPTVRLQPGRMRELLVGAEVAMTLMLVTTGMLLLISFVRVLRVEKGFETHSILTFDITLPSAKYVKPEDVDHFHTRLLAELNTMPGVVSAGFSSMLPLQGNGSVSPFTVEGDTRPPEQRPLANYRYISLDYLGTLRIPLLHGRMFDNRDRTHKVAIISQTTAARMWLERNPVGQHFRRFGQDAYEVIGVAADTRSIRLQEDPGLLVYLPYWDRPQSTVSLAVHTAGDPIAFAPTARAVVAHVDGEVPVSRMQSLDQLLNGSVARRRFQMILIVLFAITSLLLGCIGIYSVLAQTVARKTAELGIRMALGADKLKIQGLVLFWGMRPVVLGSLAGIAAALIIARVLRTLIFGVSASDPLILIGAMIVVALTAVLACYMPARKAASIEPMAALRSE